MPLFKTSFARKITIFLVAAMFSLSAIALDFNQTQRLASQGNASAQYNLGVMYYKGDGVPQDRYKATEWFQKAANQGHIKAESNLKVMSTNAAVEILREAANQGAPRAQYSLGLIYQAGESVHQDSAKAFEWYTKAANQGNADAQYNLGWMYRKGEGVRQDHNKAFEWYTKAANQGNAEAQAMLGSMYSEGEGVHQDDSKAAQWIEKSANQGRAKSQAMIGLMYYYGEGVPQNVTIAKEWFSKSCDNGDQNGCDAYREFNQEETVLIKNDDRCRPLATLAEGIMDARQSGYSIVKALKAAEDTNGGDVEFYKAIVVAAYSEPKYTTKEDQKNASTEFGIKAYLSCLNALS